MRQIVLRYGITPTSLERLCSRYRNKLPVNKPDKSDWLSECLLSAYNVALLIRYRINPHPRCLHWMSKKREATEWAWVGSYPIPPPFGGKKKNKRVAPRRYSFIFD